MCAEFAIEIGSPHPDSSSGLPADVDAEPAGDPTPPAASASASCYTTA